jgi:hypothetical protein
MFIQEPAAGHQPIKIQFNIIPSIPRTPKWSLSDFGGLNMCVYNVFACYMSHPSFSCF